MTHAALSKDNVAVITGGADGIGLAAATHFAGFGMTVCIADNNSENLQQAQATLPDAHVFECDVTSLANLQQLEQSVREKFGRIDVLMNNAGIAAHCGSWVNRDSWETVLQVNLFGVINGMHAFLPNMIAQQTPGLVINTGSKQGITTPPGNPAYNVSKAGVKAATEALAHELRNTEGCEINAHLLIPGFTYTGMVKRFLKEKPDSAWLPEQVIDYMQQHIDAGDFYILCPDNDVDRETDGKRIAWAAGDIIENRPALSRWHPEYGDAFTRFMEE
jgi:NAD(P)-dependent dehydrogenase (short-subunit alcohol dehydrogenase family)